MKHRRHGERDAKEQKRQAVGGVGVLPAGDEIVWSSRASSGQKYLSMTATLLMHSEEQLIALYQELNEHELVLTTL